ncbi:S8 family serine peptidase [Actinoplanes sp. RD1]|uniref:S8 family serine peptidase n=1 Tax=Actinoplanes sp. RD1 TaxID=3064538 RepID=UPI002740F9D4|nr:S8 family serine peptidase [Actinoplanes sp. RD1]
MDPLELVRLPGLMALTEGRPEVVVGLVDGPVEVDHPGLVADRLRVLGPPSHGPTPPAEDNAAAGAAGLRHGTFVAGVLAARRGSGAPGIAPGCSLLIRPILTGGPGHSAPGASAGQLATAIVDLVVAGCRVLNVSAAFPGPSIGAGVQVRQALDFSMRRGALVVAAAGNHGSVTASVLTRHPWVVPVAGYSLSGAVAGTSDLGRPVGAMGVGAPGEGVVSLLPGGGTGPGGGTSVAAPFVAGTAALLWSLHPTAPAGAIKDALRSSAATSRRGLAPPLLDAAAAWARLGAYRRKEPHHGT